MKLSSARVAQAVDQFEAQPIPDNHPAVSQLNELFGDHTFFLDASGLHIVEPTEPTETGDPAGQVVKLASWTDASRDRLVAHEPEPTEVVVVLGSEDTPDQAS